MTKPILWLISVLSYALIDGPNGRRTTDEWCAQMNIPRYTDIQKLIDDSDALIVLSPDNCEMHEMLCELPMTSGKPVYVDKTFAPDGETARRIFALADRYRTPCYSTSALRYADEYAGINPEHVKAVSTWGPNGFEIYSIHQLEPIMMLIRSRASRVLASVCAGYTHLVIEFEDGKRASMTTLEGGSPFMTNILSSDGNAAITVKSDYFRAFIRHMLDFLRTGKTEITHEETIAIMETRCAGLKAIKAPGRWVKIGMAAE